MRYERYGMLLMVALIYMSNRTGFGGLGAVVSWVLDKLWFIPEFAFSLVVH